MSEIAEDGTIRVDLEYPRVQDSEAKRVRISLTDVRSADDIIVEYDFDRDGWRIMQQAVAEGDDYEQAEAREWREVAYVEAWGLEQA